MIGIGSICYSNSVILIHSGKVINFFDTHFSHLNKRWEYVIIKMYITARVSFKTELVTQYRDPFLSHTSIGNSGLI